MKLRHKGLEGYKHVETWGKNLPGAGIGMVQIP